MHKLEITNSSDSKPVFLTIEFTVGPNANTGIVAASGEPVDFSLASGRIISRILLDGYSDLPFDGPDVDPAGNKIYSILFDDDGDSISVVAQESGSH